jgi:hypothetical protein
MITVAKSAAMANVEVLKIDKWNVICVPLAIETRARLSRKCC